MSKSVEGSYINLTDNLETIKNKLASAPTDSGKGRMVTSDKKQVTRNYVSEDGKESVGVKNLLTLVELFQGKDKREEYEKLYVGDGIKYKGLKEELAEAIFKLLKPIQEKRSKLEKDTKYVDKVTKEGAKKARRVARDTLVEVKEKMGLVK